MKEEIGNVAEVGAREVKQRAVVFDKLQVQSLKYPVATHGKICFDYMRFVQLLREVLTKWKLKYERDYSDSIPV